MTQTKTTLYALLRLLPWRNKALIFAHMPKAAGISMNTVLKTQYGPAHVLELDPKRPRLAIQNVSELPFQQARNLRVLSGHIIFGIHRWLPRSFVYITMLRHPVERIISTYSYIISSDTHRLHEQMLAANLSLEEFLDWEHSAEEVANLQSKLLSGLYFTLNTDSKTHYESAIANLQKYCMVGLTEEFGTTLQLFTQLFGWHHVEMAWDNVTPNRMPRSKVSPRTIQCIEELNQYDLLLYEKARQIFEEQRRDIRAVFAQKETH